jgi:hypothetical protein
MFLQAIIFSMLIPFAGAQSTTCEETSLAWQKCLVDKKIAPGDNFSERVTACPECVLTSETYNKLRAELSCDDRTTTVCEVFKTCDVCYPKPYGCEKEEFAYTVCVNGDTSTSDCIVECEFKPTNGGSGGSSGGSKNGVGNSDAASAGLTYEITTLSVVMLPTLLLVSSLRN